MVDVETIVDIAPEFMSEDRDRIIRFIDRAKTMVSASVWGDKYDLGVQYLAAHLLTISSGSAGSGPIQSETVGQMSRSYAVKADGEEFNSTKYGKRYVAIRGTLATSPLVF